MELHFLSVLGGALALLLGVSTAAHFMPFLNLETVAAKDFLIFHQLLWITAKYLPEALSYAYYLELREEFPTTEYRDPSETWAVPPWFQEPSGGSVASCDGLGCIVWNLYGGSSPTDPCPQVTGPVDPIPTSSSTDVNTDRLKEKLGVVLQEVPQIILNTGDTPLSLLNIPMNIQYRDWDVQKAGSVYRGSSLAGVSLSHTLPMGLSLSLNRELHLEAGLSHQLGQTVRRARCICREEQGGPPRVIAEYNVVVYYVVVKGTSEDLGKALVDGNLTYLSLFQSRLYNNPQPGTTYTECRMVIE